MDDPLHAARRLLYEDLFEGMSPGILTRHLRAQDESAREIEHLLASMKARSPSSSLTRRKRKYQTLLRRVMLLPSRKQRRFEPQDSTWWIEYILNPPDTEALRAKFRTRFRMPYAQFQELLATNDSRGGREQSVLGVLNPRLSSCYCWGRFGTWAEDGPSMTSKRPHE